MQGKLAPGLLSAMVRHANFERRQGQLAAAKAVFEGVIEAEAGKDSKDSATHAFAVIQYAAFLQQAMGDSSAARLAYEAALAKQTSAKSLWEVRLPSHQLPSELLQWQPCCASIGSASLGAPEHPVTGACPDDAAVGSVQAEVLPAALQRCWS